MGTSLEAGGASLLSAKSPESLRMEMKNRAIRCLTCSCCFSVSASKVDEPTDVSKVFRASGDLVHRRRFFLPVFGVITDASKADFVGRSAESNLRIDLAS